VDGRPAFFIRPPITINGTIVFDTVTVAPDAFGVRTPVEPDVR
jgi:hypothetical protein